MAALILKKAIERNMVSFGTTDVTQTVTLAVALTDTTKAILLHTVKCNSNAPINYHVLGKIISTTQIQFERAATPSVACDVEWQVVEFSQGITVQHLSVSMAFSPVDTTISTVDTAKTFCIVSQKFTGLTFGADDIATFDITSSTNLRGAITLGNAANVHSVQVVQIDDATVQKLTGTTGTGATADITVTTIDPAKTFWFFTMLCNANITMTSLPYLSYINSTTLRFTRAASTAVDFTYVVFVVSLSSGVSVQNISTVIASSGSAVSPSIPNAITVNNTAIVVNGYSQKHLTSNVGDDDAGYSMVSLSGLTTSQFTATRGASPAVSATGNVQVLEFTPASSVSWFLLANKNELYNAQSLNGMR